MKTSVLLMIAMGAAGPLWAAEPIDAGALGGVDAAIAYCSKVNPSGVPAYGKLRHSTVGADVDTEEVDAALKSPAYREAYDAAMKTSEAQSHDAAVKACSDLATTKARRTTSPRPATAKPKNSAPKPAAPKPTPKEPPASGQ